MREEKSMAAFYGSNLLAETAVNKLQKSGFDMRMLSIVGMDQCNDQTATGYYIKGERIKKLGAYGTIWGGFWGLLCGSAFFIIPGIGPLLIAGPLINALVGRIGGVAISSSTSALGIALISVGVPEPSILHYENEIKAGKFMLLAHGSKDEMEKIRNTLSLQVQKGHRIPLKIMAT